MEKQNISKATLSRLPQYLNYLKNLPEDYGYYISATSIAKELRYGEVQVRKDLASVSGKGKPKVGYVLSQLINQLEDCLGCHEATPAVLVGAGKLGRALLENDGFEEYGVKILAAFDNNREPLSKGKVQILPMSCFTEYCESHRIKIGIITVGSGSAQTVCNEMLKSGIKAIWNFAPCKLSVPEETVVKQENLALSLAFLNNQIVGL